MEHEPSPRSALDHGFRGPIGLAVLVFGALTACGDHDSPETHRQNVSFAQAWTFEDSISLEQPPGDTIAEIGLSRFVPGGGLVIADRLLPRVRLYDSDGKLVAAQGRFGNGPFEYRRVVALGADPSGDHIYVYGQGANSIVVLDESLVPNATIPTDQSPVFMEPFAGGLARLRYPSDGDPQRVTPPLQFRLFLERLTDGVARWEGQPYLSRMDNVPYWLDFTDRHAASTDRLLVTAGSFLYPLVVHDARGHVVAELDEPPPSFREARELAPGEFLQEAIGQVAPGESPIAAWLNDLTVISGIHLVEERWLVVVHGTLTWTPMRRTERAEHALDVWDLDGFAKVLEDVALPAGSRVLAGGSHLHLLVAEPPEPWTIARFRASFRPQNR